MKCPVCGNEIDYPSIKDWQFNDYVVKRYSCNKCGTTFNSYSYNGDEKFTIPKRML